MFSTTSSMEECKRPTTDFEDGMYQISGNFARWIERKAYRTPERERERICNSLFENEKEVFEGNEWNTR